MIIYYYEVIRIIYNSLVLFVEQHKVAAKRILVAKYGACAGQACIAIDYVIVEKSFSSKLVQ